ncbi:unnamed protein product [Rhizophagus irregularis]|uniref:Uncharacterized protein n=1 Tax=Rhizophagus irregularis TaxID=588596 RepID=A0A2I1GPW8_9GLOM|nr:hypothetical protein RhiirA4_525633 [Rhizophagus irregularis]CAB4443172.1 unnamed protein product [Rhizophagus irregularis]CAB4443245.1 unnamed protein product [Rhizophagus irregularis]
MYPTYTQIRSNIETFQNDRITPYSDDIERMENLTNLNDYNMTASENFSNTQDYNVQAPDYQQSHSYIDDSHLRANPVLNVNDYNVTAPQERTSFNDSRVYNVQAPVYQRQSHSYINDSHFREQIGNGNYRDYNMQTSAYRQSQSLHYNTEKVNPTLNMNDSISIKRNYQDYNVQTPLYQYSNNTQFNNGMDDALNVNDYNAITVEQTSHNNYQDYTVQDPTHQMFHEDNSQPRFFSPTNDDCVYKVEFEETSSDIVIKMLNDSLINKENLQINENEVNYFYENKYTNRFYKITCKLVSPYSTITSEQKQNLYQYLNNRLTNKC